MAVIIPSGYCQVIMTFTSGNVTDGEALVILGFGTLVGVELSDAAVGVATAWGDTVQAIQSDEYALTRVDALSPTETGAATANLIGASSSPPVSSGLALMTEKRSTARGPRAKGRAFWPGILNETTLDGAGMIESAQLISWQDVFDDFLTALGTEVGQMVILQGDDGDSAPLSPPPEVTRLLVDPQAATQRRRMRR